MIHKRVWWIHGHDVEALVLSALVVHAVADGEGLLARVDGVGCQPLMGEPALDDGGEVPSAAVFAELDDPGPYGGWGAWIRRIRL